MKVSVAAVAATTIALLSNHILPALAAVEQTVNPETTPEQLTATLETDARNYVATKFGKEEAALVFDIPFIRTGVDKAISAVVAKVLPVAQSKTAQQIEQYAPLAVVALEGVTGAGDGSSTATSAT